MDTSDRSDQQSALATGFWNPSDRHFLRFITTKVVIQEIESQLYLSEVEFCTPEIENARTFDSHLAALEAATNLKLQNVQLVTNREIKEWEVFSIKTSFRA